MKTTITAKKVTLKDSTMDHMVSKLEKLEKFFSDGIETTVTAKLDHEMINVEVTIRDKSMIYRAQHSSTDAKESFDKTLDIIVRQIRKHKTKLEKRLRSTHFEAEHFPEYIDEVTSFNVRKTKKFPVKPLDIEEAILQMNMLNHLFFMFRNERTNEINVVYRRADGDYAVIEPEI